MLVNTLLCMHGRTFALPIFSIGNPSGIFLSIALLDKTECHLVGAGLESQFPFNSLSPTTFCLWELVSSQKSWNPWLSSLFPRTSSDFPVLFLLVWGCEAQWLGPWALELDRGHVPVETLGMLPIHHYEQATVALPHPGACQGQSCLWGFLSAVSSTWKLFPRATPSSAFKLCSYVSLEGAFLMLSSGSPLPCEFLCNWLSSSAFPPVYCGPCAYVDASLGCKWPEDRGHWPPCSLLTPQRSEQGLVHSRHWKPTCWNEWRNE